MYSNYKSTQELYLSTPFFSILSKHDAIFDVCIYVLLFHNSYF